MVSPLTSVPFSSVLAGSVLTWPAPSHQSVSIVLLTGLRYPCAWTDRADRSNGRGAGRLSGGCSVGPAGLPLVGAAAPDLSGPRGSGWCEAGDTPVFPGTVRAGVGAPLGLVRPGF